MTRRSPARYHADRPTDLRRSRPWHRLSYIVDLLPRELERLSRELGPTDDSRILDYGSAEAPYRRFFSPRAQYVSADLPGNSDAQLSLETDGSLPVDADSFDVVVSTQVLEHVQDPGLYLAECFRVLRPGGRMLLSTHGIMVYHPDPDDYWRWTCAGLQRAVTDAGFRVLRFEGIMGLAATGLQLVQDAFYWRLPRYVRPLLALILQTAMRVTDRIEPPDSRRRNALVFAMVAERP